MKTILNIVRKEFQQLKRDPKMFGIILIAPILQLIVLGYAANFDVEVVHTAVYDQDRSVSSREYIQQFEAVHYFYLDYYVDSYNEMVELIDKGKIILGLVIPKDFEKNIERGEETKVQAIFDGSDGNTALISAGYAGGATASYSQQLLSEKLSKSGKKIELSNISPETRVWYNPELKTRMFMVPGIVGLLLMLITVISYLSCHCKRKRDWNTGTINCYSNKLQTANNWKAYSLCYFKFCCGNDYSTCNENYFQY